jgi:hypothetical protein
VADKPLYRVEVLGGGLRGARPEELESLLNDLAGEGWELHSISHQSNSNRVWVVLRTGRRDGERKEKRHRGWNLTWG